MGKYYFTDDNELSFNIHMKQLEAKGFLWVSGKKPTERTIKSLFGRTEKVNVLVNEELMRISTTGKLVDFIKKDHIPYIFKNTNINIY